jgi:hypothetical protein
MMSGVVSRVFRLDPKVTHEQLAAINRLRQNSNKFDEEAAIEINDSPKKPKLKHDTLPCLMHVDAGTAVGGWWNGSNFHIQVEDLADCLKIPYPGYKPLLFTDRSQGHARKRPNGLDAARMNKQFGGKQVDSQETLLKVDCFGPFKYPGMIQKPMEASTINQSFIFGESNERPCWMTQKERQETRNDRNVPGSTTK